MAIRATNYDETQYYDVAEIADVYHPNLLINGDFQCWQRGETFTFSANTETRYTADMWYVWGYEGTIYKKSSSGGIVILNNVWIVQCLENKLDVGKTYTIVFCINGIIIEKTIIGGTPYSDDRLIYTVNEEGYDRLKIHINNETLYYVDLFEGDIAYPHVKEDYATALMRCQERVLNLKGISLTIGFGITTSSSIIGLVNTPVSLKSLPSLVLEGKLKFVIDGVDGGTIDDMYVRGLTSNGVCIDFISSYASKIGSGKAVRVYFGDDTSSLTISCEPL